MIGNLKKLEIVQYKLERITTLCSALRDLAESHIELRNDFILLQGDIVTNADLRPAIELHYAKKKNKEFDTVMTKVFAQMPHSSPLRDPGQEIALLLDARTQQILDYYQYGGDKNNSYQINRKHVEFKKKYRPLELRSDVIDTEISICSKGLLTHLAEDFEMKNLRGDFIVSIQESEITEDQI